MRQDYNSLALISENLGILYDDGISILESMDILLELPLNKEYRRSLIGIKENLKKGNTLGESFEKYPVIYPKFFSGALKIGEDTGQVSQTLFNLNTFYSNLYYINKKLKTALRYPLLVLGALIMLIFLFFILILPSIYETFNSINRDVPESIREFYNVYLYISKDRTYSIALMISCISIPILVFSFIKIKRKDKENVVVLKIKIIRQYYEYIFMMNLSIILNSGMQINKGIELCLESMNISSINNEMKILNESIFMGNGIESSLRNSRILSKYSLSMIALGEKGSKLDEVLSVSSKRLEKQLLDRLNTVISYINPIAISIISIFIIIFIFLFIMPMINMIYSGVY